jgi:hypothetical protein
MLALRKKANLKAEIQSFFSQQSPELTNLE